MSNRPAGLVEAVIVVVAMVLGATFVFFAFELGKATRPGEMRVWGTESTPQPGSSPTVAARTPSVAVATATASTAQGASTPTAAASAPTATASGGGATSGDSAAGKVVFDKNCTACHPGGGKGVGPALSTADFKQRYAQDGDVAKLIRSGKGMMPAFSSSAVSDSDLTNMIKYIRSLSGG